MNPRSLLASAAVLCPLAVSSCASHDTPPVQVHARPHWGNGADWAPYLPSATTAPATTEPPAPLQLLPVEPTSVVAPNHEDESPPLGGSAMGGAWDCIRAVTAWGVADPVKGDDMSDGNCSVDGCP